MKIVVFDVETTGISTDRDQVIEICIQSGLGAEATSQTWRCKPSVPIAPQAQRVHGISDADLADCPPFAAYAQEIRSLLSGAEVLVGYNISFDLAMVQAEFGRLKLEPLDLTSILLVDPYQIWRHFEPRDLNSAHKRFVGQPFEGAHAAAEDVAATGRVLEGMMEAFQLQGQPWEKISELCDVNSMRRNWIGPTHHFQIGEQNVVFGFGKHRGRSVFEVKQEDRGGYLSWLSAKDFPDHVKQIAQFAIKNSEEDFSKWVRETFKR